MIWLIIAIVLALLIAGIIIAATRRGGKEEPPHKAAGDAGEDAAAAVIKRVLKKGDKCLRNVQISYDGQITELDFVIVNQNGVFIIEVKNYSGKITGKEDDATWKKTKTSRAGKTYVNQIENPAPQVKREEYILGNFLRSNRIRVWVEGYVFFIRGNRPVNSQRLLNSGVDIDHAIHKESGRQLGDGTVKQIVRVLGNRKMCTKSLK